MAASVSTVVAGISHSLDGIYMAKWSNFLLSMDKLANIIKATVRFSNRVVTSTNETIK